MSKSVAVDLVTGFSEALLDAEMEQGFLRDIPILGSAVGLARSSKAVRDCLFLRKIQAFLSSFDEVSDKEKEKMRERIKNEKQRARLGEKLVFILEQADEIEKARLIAECFALYCEQEIEVEALFRAWGALDKSFLDDLRCLHNYLGSGNVGQGREWELLSTGVLRGEVINYQGRGFLDYGEDKSEMVFTLTPVGQLLYRIVCRNQERESSLG